MPHRVLIALGPAAVAVGLTIFAVLAAVRGSSFADCPPCDVSPSEWSRLSPGQRWVEQEKLVAYQLSLPKGTLDMRQALQPHTPEPWPEGIFETGQAPLPHIDRIVNQWQTDTSGSHIQVYAGSLETEPAQGVIVVHVTPLDLSGGEGGAYLTPTKAGAVRIVAVDGQHLELVSATGAVFTFDVATRSFVEPETLPIGLPGSLHSGRRRSPQDSPFRATSTRLITCGKGS